eukprot:TRINITY_DN2407_c0_g1_i2.p3 TRINITY_DN2407_c0_g1~~TRINITY_DN2407_c0_g1_i2.p3  ORF type:complete len:291 (+),score=37.09 TRINITY_DN2407_c0_g1_i2:109-981(+)
MSEREQMVSSESHTVDIETGSKKETEHKTTEQLTREAAWWSLNNIPTALLILMGGLSIIFFILSLVGLSAYCIYLGIVGLFGIGLGTGQTVQLGSMSKQVDRFRQSNEELEKQTSNLTEEVGQLESNNTKLAENVKLANQHVEELKVVADGLHEKLHQFMDLNDYLEQQAEKTGQDVQELLVQSQQIRNNMKEMTLENERALLGQISQDLEFVDGQEGIDKENFERFCRRVPRHLQPKLKAMNIDFDKIAGADKVVDYKEMQQFIDALLGENTDKKKQLEETKAQTPSLI